MSTSPTLVWFRQDLRLDDNPALHAAAQRGPVLPLYILDDGEPWTMGAASRWWLHHSLTALNAALGGDLWVLRGDASDILPRLAAEQGIEQITWNRCYEPWRRARDSHIEQRLLEEGIQATSFSGSLLWEPSQNLKQDGTPYKVFTPFYKFARANTPAREVLHTDRNEIDTVPCEQGADRLSELELMPKIKWYEGLEAAWTPGEIGAGQRLDAFIEGGLGDYPEGRDFPAKRSVSLLSPHLHFGEISPSQAIQAVERAGSLAATETQAEHFIRELAWREFSYYSLYHFPELHSRNMKPRFDRFPWSDDAKSLALWQRGQTGFPLVDAGMRELWQTGYMHNRVRMIVGSFLVKNLLIHWREGASWFWDCLVDADLANNSCSWQWVAGSGADAAPYFRIFNPVTQSQKFDPKGEYIRCYVPELRKLSDKAIHDPSAAKTEELERAGVVLGKDYPRAMVDLKQSRARALEAYKTLTA